MSTGNGHGAVTIPIRYGIPVTLAFALLAPYWGYGKSGSVFSVGVLVQSAAFSWWMASSSMPA